MRLLSLKVEPLGQNGWGSPLFEFGKRTTLVFAKNGSGKTPVIQSLAAGLGFPLKFREDILEKCASITLTAEHNEKALVIRRVIGSKNQDFQGAIEFGGGRTECFNEGSFSDTLFSCLDLEPPRLVSNKGEAAQPYISTVLPVFYLNQGDGYTAAYKSPAPFINDQFVEMVRFVFGLNPKHSFDVKKSLINEKSALEAKTRQIVAAQRILDNQSQEIDDGKANREALRLRAEEFASQIENLRDSFDTKNSTNSTLIQLINQKDSQISSKLIELYELKNRVSGIEAIRTEIEGEVKTLSLNEEARRVFTSFNEICGAANCGLFLGSTESYGKNLLYLRDQIKDLERNSTRAEIRIEALEGVLDELRQERQVLAEKIDPATTSIADQLITTVHVLTKQLIETQSELGRIFALDKEKSNMFNLLQDRDRIQERIENLSNTGISDHSFNKLRLQLRELAVKWMDILETKNVSRNVDIDLDMRFKFNNESLDLFSGSTKIRLVLAIHAALFEAYISEPSRPFRFLILDTPKQQELHTEDLANYLTELEKLCTAKNAQLILSSTEYDHPTGPSDKRWLPEYKGPDHSMYLGKQTDYLGDSSS